MAGAGRSLPRGDRPVGPTAWPTPGWKCAKGMRGEAEAGPVQGLWFGAWGFGLAVSGVGSGRRLGRQAEVGHLQMSPQPWVRKFCAGFQAIMYQSELRPT